MKPQTGKYYHLKNSSKYLKIYDSFECTETYISVISKEVYMAYGRTRIEVRKHGFTGFSDYEEITNAQFDRIERLANARIKQYEYYVINSGVEALCDEIDQDFNISKP